ncbi:tail fiber domain-containing protein [Burkholderia cepacia]|uniref:tail fiber domain-containing protein n=1 Tax=Burkholderia cepacia TaxID=292 RepID=UPI00249EE877|nr:tail fiber domain-containing protein [Burkholderia cepacia]WGY71955.1 tail fiber domain-containing protein [Burkholderia cepacia]
MPQLQKANLGVAPSGAGGDDQRTANMRFNANVDVLSACVALGYAILNDNTTLQPSQVGARFGLNMGGGGKVVKFPLASSVSLNACIHCFNVGPPVAIGFQGSDGSPIKLLNTGDWATYVADGGTYWHVAERGKMLWDEAVGGNLTVGGSLSVAGGVAGNVAASGKVGGFNGANILLNGSGELGNIGWASSGLGVVQGGYAEGIFFSNLAPITSGNYVLDYADLIPCAPRLALNLSAELNAQGMTQGQARIKIEALDASKSMLSELGSIAVSAGTGGWQYRSVTVTTPDNTAYIRVARIADFAPRAPAYSCSIRRIKVENGYAASLYSQEASIAYLAGAPVFSGVPKFGSYAPWHSGNLDLANFAALASNQTFTGTNTFQKSIVSSFTPADYSSLFYASKITGYAFNDWNKSSAVVLVECGNNGSAYQLLRAQKAGERDLFALSAYAGGSSTSVPSVAFTFSRTINAFQFWDGGNATFTGSLSQGSDYRIKTSVEDIDASVAYEGVRRLRFVDYLKTTNVGEGANRRIAGVIAHEAQGVFANVVNGEKDAVEDDGRLKLQTVDYTGLGIYIGAAVQHMATLIESLKADVVKLRAEVAILKGSR